MKVLILGSRGMLGTDLMNNLSKQGQDVIGLDTQDIDITKKEGMTLIEEINPKIIVNCAAYTKVDLAEKEREKCHLINVVGVKNIVDVCKKKDIILIQLSTDYVFDGTKESFNEDDKKNPINYYGKTKAEAEDVIINNLEKYYILRTSWLFGKNGQNFIKTIQKLSDTKEEIKVVKDQIGSPTYTEDISENILKLVDYNFGIYHLTNSESCSWFEFASEIVNLVHSSCIVKPCLSDEFPSDAKRPLHSTLNNNKWPKLRSWKAALKAYLEVE